MHIPVALVSLMTVALTMTAGTSYAAAADERDWPCEQAFVSEVPAAVVWDGPSVDDVSEQRIAAPAVGALVNRLTARRFDIADAESAIEQFAKAQPAAERDQQLTAVFAGVLRTLNRDRSQLNDGILRYARDQQRRADMLGRHLSEYAQLEADATSNTQRLAVLRTQMEMEQRIFDERESAIPFLCTRPRVLEQRIGELARTIAYHLE